ncbi:DUF1161 domain-containing protein [Variovorax ginsengisoli]|uniref:DUF1161 domain-containing protein n=1 Tax=Variovorax ginsengisoli TaxID=363844 RepID=A0ABT9S6T9_9BURK|nr:DUF1161 domain-containing protein [Variovorax ginsengisoli]MDP9899614.1 hypothetical protein [Variovorax ginsengisoli]
MKQRFFTTLRHLSVCLATFASLAAHAANDVAATTAAPPAPAAAPAACDTLRAQIEAKIAAAGVSHFAVTVVDAQAAVEGQVVGSCELGTKKVVYQRQAVEGAAAASPAQPAPAQAGDAPMITECKDGSTSVGGNCGK